MLTLKQLRAEIRRRLPMIDGVIIRNAELDRAINKAYREMVKKGDLLKDSALSCGIDDQERYDLTSSDIWLQDSGLTDSTANTNEAVDATETIIDVTSDVFSANQIIKIDSEIMFITKAGTGSITVIRGVSNTTAATHTTATDIYIGAKPAILKMLRVDWNEYEADLIGMNEIINVDVT